MGARTFDLVLRGGRVIDPAQGIDGVMDVGIRGKRIAAVGPELKTTGTVKNVRGKLVLPGPIDTHAHVYENVTGVFGLNADQVGIRSGVTTVVDQGGAGGLAPGTAADVSVVGLERGEWTVRDASGAELRLGERIRPDFAVREGVVKKSDSPLVPEVLTAAA